VARALKKQSKDVIPQTSFAPASAGAENIPLKQEHRAS
jgi:hypothetical protein